MIFDGKTLGEISDQEIELLIIRHISENQHLEYKLTIEHKSDVDRFETLCDITSLANVGGGYLIVGIRDDGKGKAQKFESVEEPEKILRSVQSLCIDYISERIDGIECQIRNIAGSNVILIRIPNSIRIPHMVTIKNRTHFSTRYIDGKRTMTIGEIRAAFTDNLFGRRLNTIQEGLKNIIITQANDTKANQLELLDNGQLSLLNVTDGEVVTKALKKRMLNEFGSSPMYRFTITPITLNRNYFDVDSKDIQNFMKNPPNQRPSGWNMEAPYSQLQRFPEGLIRKFQDIVTLILLQNGHMEFYRKINDTFCWDQTEEEYKKIPRLYPYTLIEYPLSFYRMYKDLLTMTKKTSESFIITMQLFNVKNHTLRPCAPNSVRYRLPMTDIRYGNQSIDVPEIKIGEAYSPDAIVFELIKYVYASFGYSTDDIPFYIKEQHLFLLE